jgi:hypothetical protein
MHSIHMTLSSKTLLIVSMLLLSACGGGGGSSSSSSSGGANGGGPPPATYTIGGTVTGLVGTGLVLRNNGGDDLSIPANGPFRFSSRQLGASPFNVNVLTQPTSPAQTCTITNGTGVVNAIDITDVRVTCVDVDGGGVPAPQLLHVAGTATGLSGSGLVVRNNGGDNLPISSSGQFEFLTALPAGAPFNVTVAVQPTNPAQECTVLRGAGTIGVDDATHVDVRCADVLLTLVDSTPTSTAGGVERNVRPILRFSAALDASTVNTNRVKLASAQGDLEIALSVSGNEIAIDPKDSLLPATQYTLRVASGIRGSGGQQLVSDVEATFTTRDRNWQVAEYVASEANFRSAQVAVDSSGNVMTVWSQDATSGQDIWARRYTMDHGWQDAQRIDTIDNVSADPQLGVDAQDNVVVIWTDYEEGLWSRTFTANSETWGQVVAIDPGATGSRQEPKIAVAANGDAVTVWVQKTGQIANVFAAHYVAGGGWGAPTGIQADSSQQSRHARVAIRPSGAAVAVWDEPSRGVQANLYDGSQWGTATDIDVDSDGGSHPQIAVDRDGNALAIWEQPDENAFVAIMATRYSPQTAWAAPFPVSDLTTFSDASDARVAISDHGEAMVVWNSQQADLHVLARRYHVQNDQWDPSVQLDVGGLRARRPSVSMDAHGNALVAWEQTERPQQEFLQTVRTTHYSFDSGWSTPSLQAIAVTIDDGPHVAVSADGDAAVVWLQFEFSAGLGTSVRTARFE